MSQRWSPQRGSDPVLIVDASSGNETVPLTLMAADRRVTVRRVDSSNNTVTVAVTSGLTLDGVLNGTTTVAKDSEKQFVSTDAGFESFGGSAGSASALAADPAFTGTYSGKRKDVTGRLLAQFTKVGPLTPAVASSVPTVSVSATQTLATRRPAPILPSVRHLGGPVTFDPVTGKWNGGASTVALDFWLDGDTVEVGWFTHADNAERLWVWVDGQPITSAPYAPGGGVIPPTTAGEDWFIKLVFGSVARRRVTIYGALLNAWASVSIPVTASVSPAPRLPRIGVLGDSFADYSGPSGNNPIFSFPFVVARALGAEVIQRGIGGTGYTTAQPFGQAARVASMQSAAPDVLVIAGSVNDDGASGIQAAATACYNAYAAALPDVPIIVVGPQATNATDTISANRQANAAAVRAAALAHPQVLGFYDPCGHADLGAAPSAYSAGTTYSTGNRVTHLGSVWELANGSATVTGTAPSGSARWALKTWALTGTGRAGATASDGSRDLLLGSLGDSVHPTAAGMDVFGLNVAHSLVDALAAAAAPAV